MSKPAIENSSWLSSFTSTMDPKLFLSIISRMNLLIVMFLMMSNLVRAEDSRQDFTCEEFQDFSGNSGALLTLPTHGAKFCLSSNSTNPSSLFSFSVKPIKEHGFFGSDHNILDCEERHAPARWLDNTAHFGLGNFFPVACPKESFEAIATREMLRTCAHLKVVLSHLAEQHPDNQTFTQALGIFNDFFERTSCEPNDAALPTMLGSFVLMSAIVGGCLWWANKTEDSHIDNCLRALKRSVAEFVSEMNRYAQSCLCSERSAYNEIKSPV